MCLEVFAILKKYNYRLPKTYEQKVNKYIKEIAEQAGIIEPIEVEEMQNGKTIKFFIVSPRPFFFRDGFDP